MASRSRGGRAAASAAIDGRGRLDLLGGRIARTLIAHQHRTAAGLLALLVLAYLWPVLLAGKVLVPTALLYELTPWKAGAPAGVARFVNGELADVALSYYPWDVLARQLIHAGTFPAWNPYALAGTPFFANPEVAWLSPFSLPLWILPLNYGLGVAAALKLWVAGFGTYLLVRELRLGFWPGMVAGVAYALCAFNVVWLTHGVFVSSSAMLPWSIWLVERIGRRGRSVDALALAGVVAVALAGGHPGTELHVLAATGLYALVRAATARDVAVRARVRHLLLVGAAIGVGALLVAVALLPAQRAAIDTVGAASRRNGVAGNPASSMGVGMIRTALFPDWWGRPSDVVASTQPLAHYRERTFYAGSAVLVLAVIGLLAAGRWRAKLPLLALGALGASVALAVPGIQPLVVHLPLFDRVQDQRILLWFLFAISVLAAFGLEAVLARPTRQRRTAVVLAAALLAALVALATLRRDGATARLALHYALHRSGAITPDALALASVGWWLAFVAVFAAIVVYARRSGRVRIAGALVALLVALDLLHFAHGYQPMGPAHTVVPPATPTIAYLQRHAGDTRIAGLGDVLKNDYGTVYGLHDVRGYDAPQPTLRWLELWVQMGSTAEPFSVGGYTSEVPRLLGLLGAGYVVTDPGLAPQGTPLQTVFSGRDATVFRNPYVVPRAFVVGRAIAASTEQQEIGAVAAERFAPRRLAVVRGSEARGLALPRDGAGSARVVDERNARVALTATLRRPGLVVLDDQWAPGWSVRVDGRPARALETDVVLRGVVVPAGRHSIVWSYRVPGLRAGAALSVVGLAIVAAWGGLLLVRRRRSVR